jgi:hypothetical protein
MCDLGGPASRWKQRGRDDHAVGVTIPGRNRTHALVVVATTAGLVRALHRLGSGSFAAPPVHAWSALTRWYEETPPEVVAVATLRLVALALAEWLLVAAMLQLLAAMPGLRPLGCVADLISPRSLQRLGHGLAGLSLTAGLAVVVPGAGIPAVPPLPVAATLATGDDDPNPPSSPPALPASGEGTASMRLVDDGLPAPGPPPAPARSGDVTVEVGDSFWSIAAEEMAQRTGAPPSERQIVPYWRQLIEHNRVVLVDPGNPDLLYPGQVVSLPPA